MAPKINELHILQNLSEEQFRQDVLIPLLSKMGMQKVRERHGTQEYGKDITFFEPSEFGNTRYAVVAKVGQISGAARGRINLETVKTQITQAFTMPYFDLEDKQDYTIDKVIVWTTGKISNNAQEQIKQLSNLQFKYVDFRDGVGTLELLNKHYPAYFTINDPIISEYFDAVKSHFCRLEELRTLGASDNEKKLPLVFIPLFFTEFAPRKLGKERRKIFSIDDLGKEQKNIVVLGEAGSGKSTLLRRMLITIIESNEKSGSKYPIPILLRLRVIDFSLNNPIKQALEKEFKKYVSPDAILNTNEFEKGNIVVFLDGLDELETKEDIEKSISEINQFNETYPKAKIFIASRILSLFESSDILPRYHMFRIQDLSPEQMVSFVEKWYGENTTLSHKLINLIKSPESLRGLPATPLTIALIAILQEHNSYQEIPANQTELFSKYIELALGRWDVSKNISMQFEFPIKRYILQQISWDIHNGKKTSLHPNDFDRWILMLAEEYGLSIDLKTFKKEVIERSELIFLNENGEYEFKHISFQDYFVGLEINRRTDSADLVVSNFLDPWWSGAIFFAGGLRPDNPEYVEKIISLVEVRPEASMIFAYNLGELLQATYMSTVNIKKTVIRKVIEEIINSWEYSAKKYLAVENKPQFPRNLPPHIMFLIMHGSISLVALGSVTLSKALSELAKETLENLDRNNISGRGRLIEEWKAFLLAMACSECESNIPDFLKIFDSGKINDPGFIFIGRAITLKISHDKWIDETLRNKVEELGKKLDKRFKSVEDDYKKLLNKEKILLLPSA